MYVQKRSASVAGNATHSWTVPTNKIHVVHFGHVILTTDGTAANRYLEVSIIDADSNEIFDTHSGAAVTASTSNQHHTLMPGIYRETSFTNGSIQVPIPAYMVLMPGFTFQVSVTNGVAGDSYTSDWILSEVDPTVGPFTDIND
jgi:hypothetical protein